MGLDQYLSASEYVSRSNYVGQGISHENPLFNEIVNQLELENVIDSEGFAGITVDVPVGYWRKANQIHNWFVENLADGEDNCQSMFVTRKNLQDLRDLCLTVIANPETAEDLLPTGAGFFFGSTEYDQYYFADLNDTIGIITRCLETKYEYFEYRASW